MKLLLFIFVIIFCHISKGYTQNLEEYPQGFPANCLPSECFLSAVFANGTPNYSCERSKFDNILITSLCDPIYCNIKSTYLLRQTDSALLFFSKNGNIYRYHVCNSGHKNYNVFFRNVFPLNINEKIKIESFTVCVLDDSIAKDTLYNSKPYFTRKNKKKINNIIDSVLNDYEFVIFRFYNIVGRDSRNITHILNDIYLTVYNKDCKYDYYDHLKQYIQYDRLMKDFYSPDN